MSLLRHIHTSTIPRLTALLFGHKRSKGLCGGLTAVLKLQRVKKTCATVDIHEQNTLQGPTKSVAMSEVTI